MKDIKTLIPDIYDLVQRKDGWFNELLSRELSNSISTRLFLHFNRESQKPTLRLSQMGPRCPCALWYSIHHPELAEALPPWAEVKYSYGHVIEALAITLARASGHTVTGEQDELILDGIVGHRDCVIDGCVVDVKSASSISYRKFKEGSISRDDPFGYLDQLDGYVCASLEDPLVLVKDRGYLLVIDKTLGHMCLYEHYIRKESIRSRIRTYRDIVGRSEAPLCECKTIPQGKSGNVSLDTRASYSPFKYQCFPNLRTFHYADGPSYLTHVERTPDVKEIDKHGRAVYQHTAM